MLIRSLPTKLLSAFVGLRRGVHVKRCQNTCMVYILIKHVITQVADLKMLFEISRGVKVSPPQQQEVYPK